MKYHDTPARMAKTKTLTTLSVDKDMEQWELSVPTRGSCNGSTILENGLAVYTKVKHMSTLWPRNSTLGIYPKEMNVLSSEDSYKILYSLWLKLEMTQMFMYRKMVHKLWYIYIIEYYILV